ncbi:MAG TPA: glycerophosphodiester phosphodiesterase [Planctomycetota bacterium]|nr:glycerophosphodiester phosphodiesterase [Planctomycetota bacterium]
MLVSARFLPVLTLICSSACFAAGYEICAHRGASVDAPENTLAAAKLAFDQGADYVECDIYLSSDGKLVVIHDHTTKRTTGQDGEVEKMTLAELKTHFAGATFKDKKYAEERIPTLEELLNIVPKGKRLIIEIKTAKPEAITELKAVLERTKKSPKSAEIFSFNFKQLELCKKLIPEYASHWLVGYSVDKETKKPKTTIDEVISKAKAGNMNGLSLAIAWPIDAEFTKKVHDAGLKLFVWNANDGPSGRRLRDAGVDVICTDKPALMVAELKK